ALSLIKALKLEDIPKFLAVVRKIASGEWLEGFGVGFLVGVTFVLVVLTLFVFARRRHREKWTF
uniref:Uncharacterized protein n=1 Tax=Acrobeloides nanus TaxID=290746 RepID=A0A914EKG0_9BILA